MVKLPEVGFIQETYCTFMISLRDSLFRSYLEQSETVGKGCVGAQAGECRVKGRCHVPHHSYVQVVVETEKRHEPRTKPGGSSIYGNSVGRRDHKDALRGRRKIRVQVPQEPAFPKRESGQPCQVLQRE